MAFAGSAEEVENIYSQLIADLDANGAAGIEEIYTQNYAERVALWYK